MGRKQGFRDKFQGNYRLTHFRVAAYIDRHPKQGTGFHLSAIRHQQALWSITDQKGTHTRRPMGRLIRLSSGEYAQGIYIIIIRYYDKAVSRNKMVVGR